eukprot:1220419-Prymnesium_polylepis.1
MVQRGGSGRGPAGGSIKSTHRRVEGEGAGQAGPMHTHGSGAVKRVSIKGSREADEEHRAGRRAARRVPS